MADLKGPKNQRPSATSQLGKIRDEVVGEFSKTAKDAGKQIVSEPKKILESILGAPKSDEDVFATNDMIYSFIAYRHHATTGHESRRDTRHTTH